MFLPNTEPRLCEFQYHRMPPNYEFYPYIESNWRIDDNIPVIETWGESTNSAASVWVESEKSTVIIWNKEE